LAPIRITSVPRCNFTVSLQNDGAYTARFKVQYDIDGIRQPVLVSRKLHWIGQVATITIPYYAQNILVSLEKYGFFSWVGIAQDTGINTQNACTKCYKTWHTVTDSRWDYVIC
jgi:hypothetical protein